MFHGARMQVQWLMETELMGDLLGLLAPGRPRDAARHAAQVLATVARTTPSPLQRAMGEPAFLATLLERAFQPGGASSAQVPAAQKLCSSCRFTSGWICGGAAQHPDAPSSDAS